VVESFLVSVYVEMRLKKGSRRGDNNIVTVARVTLSLRSSMSNGIVAIACVVESSLTLAAEWPRVLLDYISPLLRRLNEGYPSYQVCPSPLTVWLHASHNTNTSFASVS
jgi:hypothetical protein